MATDTIVDVETKVRVNLDDVPLWDVYVLNDDVTHMDVVIDILMNVFGHDFEVSKNLMLKIHNEGQAVAGTYTFELAEQKALEATEMARAAGFPLQIRLDKSAS